MFYKKRRSKVLKSILAILRFIQKNTISSAISLHNENESSRLKNRQFPKLALNIEKDPNTHLYLKRTPRKTIKQNILESISPTFVRKSPV